MRRFSQKNHLVTLNDINITPLLDLAFVLLIIFIITTPMLENHVPMNLPAGGAEGTSVRKDQVRTIQKKPQGGYVIQGIEYPLANVRAVLAAEQARDKDMAVYVRADRQEDWSNVLDLLEIFRDLNVTKIKFAKELAKK